MDEPELLSRLRDIANAPFSVPVNFREAALSAMREIESARARPRLPHSQTTDDQVAKAVREAIRPYQRHAPGPEAALSNLEWEEMSEVAQRPFLIMARAARAALSQGSSSG